MTWLYFFITFYMFVQSSLFSTNLNLNLDNQQLTSTILAQWKDLIWTV